MEYDGLFKSTEDVENNFGVDLSNEKILYAEYSYEDYSGSAWVIFEKDGELFEVHGSHCSCYGLEGQWSPEPATPAAILHILNNGTLGKIFNADKIKAVLTSWEESQDQAVADFFARGKVIARSIDENDGKLIEPLEKNKNINTYHGDFNSQKDVEEKFEITLDSNESILFAEYNNDSYSGDAWVIFQKDGKLFEAHGSHCSCYGLEGQWDPEPTTLEYILFIIENGDKGKKYNVADLKNILEDWQTKEAKVIKINKIKKML